MRNSVTLSTLMLSASLSWATPVFVKRDSWGPAVSLGPSKAEIITTSTVIYPGKMPANQAGLLYAWLGISNGTGDLIQSIIGSYPAGQSECSGANADKTWCISSEVYGLDASTGYPNQWVGELRTADVNYENGIILNYTLIDKSSYLWLQTMTDAVTGDLLSTFNKTSGPMLGWGTALECNDGCTGTIETQYYVNSTIVLETADSTFIQTLGSSQGATHTEMETADNGKTWTIAKITIPPMQSAAAEAVLSPSSSTVAVPVATPSKVVATSSGTASPTKHHGHQGHGVRGGSVSRLV